MKVTLNWLKQYVDFNWSPEELAERLTMLGLEVEGVHKLAGDFEGVVVAQILTKDKVTIRVNISAVYEVVDATVARSGAKDVSELLYRTLQIAVRQTLGKRLLEEILAEKVDIDETVSADVRREMEVFGVRVGSIAIKDIILPGDIREILNQVVTAEKQAQANLIRRREETAATRSLLNTAKLMEDNPLLVRLKELETLEKVADKVEKITVVGGLNSLLEKTVTIQG